MKKDDILLVDDNSENLKVLSSILKPKGYIIRLAMSGQKAIDSIKSKSPKLILLDVQMPDMDGYETCRILKNDKKLSQIPVIFVSALSGILDKVKAFEAGAVDYIEKPFHLDEVVARVNTHLTVKRQQEQLEEALKKVSQTQTKLFQAEKMASLGTLSAGIAHEINNPINFVNAGAAGIELDLIDLMKVLELYEKVDLKKSQPDISKRMKELKAEIDYDFIKDNLMSTIQDIKMGASRTEEIVKGLKRFSRVDGEEMLYVDVNKEIESNVKIIKRLTKKEIKFQLNLEKNITIIKGLPGQLNQLFMNLIMNAEQAIDQKGTIKIITSNKNGGVKILVADNGCGISEEFGDRIFDPFLTTKDVGEGTGLGLSISFGIVEHHNGKINYTSKIGVGTTFQIELPK
ncbi:MAG: response regulator [Vicingaceae bacterium]